VEVFHRRLAVDAAEEQPRKERGGALFDRGSWLPGNAAQIGGVERDEALEEFGAGCRNPGALQEHVVQAEREVERRIAVPRALGVEEHRAMRRDQDVLRADIAMHQAVFGCGGALLEALERAGEVRMSCGRGEEIRLKPYRVEDRV